MQALWQSHQAVSQELLRPVPLDEAPRTLSPEASGPSSAVPPRPKGSGEFPPTADTGYVLTHCPISHSLQHTPLASKKSPPSSSNTDGDNVTPPPLTPEDERTSSHVIKQRSPTPTAHGIIIPPKSIVREPHFVLAEYSSQRHSSKTFPITERWQTWTWSELRYSKWLTDTNLIPVDDEQDDGDGDSDTLLGPFTQENLPWLYRGMHNPDSTSLLT